MGPGTGIDTIVTPNAFGLINQQDICAFRHPVFNKIVYKRRSGGCQRLQRGREVLPGGFLVERTFDMPIGF